MGELMGRILLGGEFRESSGSCKSLALHMFNFH